MVTDYFAPISKPTNAATVPPSMEAKRYVKAGIFRLRSRSSSTSIITVEKVENDPRNPVPITVIVASEGEPANSSPRKKEAIMFAIKVPLVFFHLEED